MLFGRSLDKQNIRNSGLLTTDTSLKKRTRWMEMEHQKIEMEHHDRSANDDDSDLMPSIFPAVRVMPWSASALAVPLHGRPEVFDSCFPATSKMRGYDRSI